MSKHDKTLTQLDALNGSLEWKKVESLFKHFGADVYEGSGSTVTFVIDGVKFTADRPHPRRECGKGLVKRVKEVPARAWEALGGRVGRFGGPERWRRER